MGRLVLGGIVAFTLSIAGCFVEEHCSDDPECGAGRICNRDTGQCHTGCREDSDCSGNLHCFGMECVCLTHADCGVDRYCHDGACSSSCRPGDCPTGEACLDGVCRASTDGDADGDTDGDTDGDSDCDADGDELSCPPDMVRIDDYCIDIYEASRQDATATSAGTDDSIATSRVGVLPWTWMSREQASAACGAAGKRLCTALEWIAVCRGPGDTNYPYGDEYEPETCNGIDTFGRGYQHLLPTGSFSECINAYGAFDLSGNVWEIDQDYPGWVHGGAYNCIDSASLHQCSYNQDFGTDSRSNVGFRCCRCAE